MVRLNWMKEMSASEFETTLSEDYRMVYNFLRTKAIQISRFYTLKGMPRACHVDKEPEVREYVRRLQTHEDKEYASEVLERFRFHNEISKHRRLGPMDAHRSPEMYHTLPINVPVW